MLEGFKKKRSFSSGFRASWKKKRVFLSILVVLLIWFEDALKRLVWEGIAYLKPKSGAPALFQEQDLGPHALIKRIAFLEGQLAKMKNMELENAQWRCVCGWMEQITPPQSLVTCPIMNWTSLKKQMASRPFHVAVGSQRGLSFHNWVFASDGKLVGRIARVDPETAEIHPLFHPQCRLEARTEKTQEDLLLAGTGQGLAIVLTRGGKNLEPHEPIYLKGPYAFWIGQVSQDTQTVEGCCDWRMLSWIHILVSKTSEKNC